MSSYREMLMKKDDKKSSIGEGSEKKEQNGRGSGGRSGERRGSGKKESTNGGNRGDRRRRGGTESSKKDKRQKESGRGGGGGGRGGRRQPAKHTNKNYASQFSDSEDEHAFPVDAHTMAMQAAGMAPGTEGGGGWSDDDEGVHQGGYDMSEMEGFVVGDDINALLREVHENTLRVLTLVDVDNVGGFGDEEMIFLAAALKDNTSLLSLQARYLPLTDTSLVKLCQNLEKHPTLRSLDLSGTKGYDDTGKALIKLVQKNTNILHVHLEGTTLRESHIDEVHLATQYNTLWCPDPRNCNPYDAVLLADFVKGTDGGDVGGDRKRKSNKSVTFTTIDEGDQSIGLFSGYAQIAEEERRKKLQAQLGVEGGGGGSGANSNDAIRSGVVGKKLCIDHMKGTCLYGSRCVFYHPERSSTTQQRIKLEKEEKAKAREAMMAASEMGSTAYAPSGYSRRSMPVRRANRFVVKSDKMENLHKTLKNQQQNSGADDSNDNDAPVKEATNDEKQTTAEPATKRPAKKKNVRSSATAGSAMILGVVAACSATVIGAVALSSKR